MKSENAEKTGGAVPCIVTLDGPAGVGKSTLARQVAAALGVAYLDTGAMFRTIALRLEPCFRFSGPSSEAVEAARADVAAALAREFSKNSFALEGSGESARLLCDGAPVGEEIRTEEAGMLAARAGLFPEVRDFLKAAQRRLGAVFSLVAEGRDMGTVVFPDACCKIFLDAAVEVRAERRCLQLREQGKEADPAQIAEQIRLRDEQDSNRDIAPLRPAKDARIIDTSRMGTQAVRDAILRVIQERASSPRQCALRRKDRAIPRDEALDILRRGEYGVLAMTDADGWPYAVPLSFVFMDDAVYFHSAKSGRKAEALGRDNRVCFTVVGDTEPVYSGDFSTFFESALVFGRVAHVENAEEKYRSLRALAQKYLPEHMDKFDSDLQKSIKRTAVFKLLPEIISGKAKRR